MKGHQALDSDQSGQADYNIYDYHTTTTILNDTVHATKCMAMLMLISIQIMIIFYSIEVCQYADFLHPSSARPCSLIV